MTTETRTKFRRLDLEMSPEHVARDGEASKAEIARTTKRLGREWVELENEENGGVPVTTDEIWDWT